MIKQTPSNLLYLQPHNVMYLFIYLTNSLTLFPLFLTLSAVITSRRECAAGGTTYKTTKQKITNFAIFTAFFNF